MRYFPRLSDWHGKTFSATLSSILCASWKVLNEPKVHTIKAWDFSRWSRDMNDDYTVLKEIVKVMEGADMVVTHNGKRFDWPFFQTRLLTHGLKPMHEIAHADTALLARRNLKNIDNRLGTIGREFCKDTKLENGGWDLWERIQFETTQKDLNLMQKYCEQDVLLLEKVFKLLRPFAKNIPNYNLHTVGEQNICPSCGSSRLRHNGYRSTKTMSYKRLKCLDCGSSSRTDIRGLMPRSI